MRACWYDEVVDHDGARFHYEGLRVRPQPARLDVWLGGIAPSELRRVGRLADGWLPSFITPADAEAGRRVVEQIAAEHGRAIEDDHYGALIPYTLGSRARRAAGDAGPAAPRPRRPRLAGVGRLGRLRPRSSASSRSARRSSWSCPSTSRVTSGRGTPTWRWPPTRCARSRPDQRRVRASGERGHRRVAPGDAGHAAAPPGAGAAQEDVACAVSTPQVPSSAGALGERPLQVAVEDVAARHRQRRLDLPRSHHLDAVRVVQAVLDRLGQHGVERAQDGPPGGVQRAVRIAVEQAGRHVQGEQREGLRALVAQAGVEDGRVAQRVAVDLAGRDIGHPAVGRLPVGRLELLVALVDVERAGEGPLGAHLPRRAAPAAATAAC